MIAVRENIPYDRYLRPSSTYRSASVNGECSRVTIPNGRVSIIIIINGGGKDVLSTSCKNLSENTP